jgi:hypothetical protein
MTKEKTSAQPSVSREPMAKKRRATQSISVVDILAQRINAWSRGLRILMTTLVTSILVLVFGFLLDLLILDTAGGQNATPYILIVTTVGVLIYGFGWHLMVGFDWDVEHPWEAGRGAAYFILAGALGILAVIVGLLMGLAFGYLI